MTAETVARMPNPPDDGQVDRCGHNFFVMECPYRFCGYRDTLTVLQELLKAQKRDMLPVLQELLQAQLAA